jgi:cyanate permease
METANLKSSRKYAWLLVLGLGLMSAGTTGSYSVVAGSFLTPVCDDLGIDITDLSYYFTFTLLALSLTLPFVGKLLPKVVGKTGLTVISIVLLVAGAAMAFYTQVWMWFASAIVIGACFAFTTGVCMGAVVGQWFRKNAGLAIGLCWTVNSVYMLVMSPVITSLIESIGWRNAYLVLAGVSALLVLPSTLLIIRYKPADKGMLPYGYKQGIDDHAQDGAPAPMRGVPFKVAVKSPAFFACVGFLCLVQLTVCMNQLFPTYAVEVGFSPLIGGLMVSAASMFDIFLNPAVGSTCDKFGTTKALLVWICVSILSFVMLIFATGHSWLAIFAAGVNDVMYVIAGAGLTVLIMEVFGSRDFGRIFALTCSIGYIVGAFGMPVMTGVYSATGSFTTVFGLCIALNIVIAGLLIFARKSGKKLKWEETDAAPSIDN